MLYLVRHGQAKGQDEDPQRPLTDRGADDVTRVARLAPQSARSNATDPNKGHDHTFFVQHSREVFAD